MTTLSGTKLGRYEVLKCLAHGATTDLLLARTRGMAGFERHVVIKRIHNDRADDPAFVQAFTTEARLAAALHHNNIVQVQDIGEDGGAPYFAMEYVHGEDVRTLLAHLNARGQRLPLEHVITIITAVASALHHAHERTTPDGKPLAIVHRDVTPTNILVGYDGNVKVVDFGIAKAAITITTQVGVLKGRSPYMAPEQCAGQPVDRRSDVFALGIVLWEMATMRRLFKGKTDHDTMRLIVQGDVPRPSTVVADIPIVLEGIIMKAMAKSPANRYQSAAEMAQALETFATTAGLASSTSALAAYLAQHIGPRPEPWLVEGSEPKQRVTVDFDAVEEIVPDTNKPTPVSDPSSAKQNKLAATPAVVEKKVPAPAKPADAKPVAKAPPRTTPASGAPTVKVATVPPRTTPASGAPTVKAATVPPATPASGTPTVKAATAAPAATTEPAEKVEPAEKPAPAPAPPAATDAVSAKAAEQPTVESSIVISEDVGAPAEPEVERAKTDVEETTAVSNPPPPPNAKHDQSDLTELVKPLPLDGVTEHTDTRPVGTGKRKRLVAAALGVGVLALGAVAFKLAAGGSSEIAPAKVEHVAPAPQASGETKLVEPELPAAPGTDPAVAKAPTEPAAAPPAPPPPAPPPPPTAAVDPAPPPSAPPEPAPAPPPPAPEPAPPSEPIAKAPTEPTHAKQPAAPHAAAHPAAKKKPPAPPPKKPATPKPKYDPNSLFLKTK